MQAGQRVDLATTSADLMTILIDNNVGYSGESLSIKDADFGVIVVDPDLNFSDITFTRCIINTVELGRSNAAQDERNSAHFHDCVIDRIEGAVSARDVPAGVLTGSTTVENYAAFTATNDAVMRSSLPSQVKVLLTILRKLFIQSGSGRQYSALRRGLPASLVRYVEPIVACIKAEAFANDVVLDRRPILIPNRSRSADALAIINGPNTSTHPLVERVRNL